MTSTGVDAAGCSDMIRSLKVIAADALYGPRLLKVLPKSVIDSATDADCAIFTAQGTSQADGPLGVLSYGTTYGFWKQIDFSILGWSIFQWHVNTGIKWTDATHYTKMWGVDCYLTSVPGYFGGYDQGGWCGIYNPQIANTAEPGSNFWISPIPLPLWKQWAWMRYDAYSSGGSSATWGGKN